MKLCGSVSNPFVTSEKDYTGKYFPLDEIKLQLPLSEVSIKHSLKLLSEHFLEKKHTHNTATRIRIVNRLAFKKAELRTTFNSLNDNNYHDPMSFASSC